MGLYMDAPETPDPKEAAQAQGAANVSSAYASNILNNPNQKTPYGTVDYSIAGYNWVPNEPGAEPGRTERRIVGYEGGGGGGVRAPSYAPPSPGEGYVWDPKESMWTRGSAGGSGLRKPIYDDVAVTGDGYYIPRFEQTVKLSPEQQRIFNKSQRLQTDMLGIGLQQFRRLGNTLREPIDFRGAPDLVTDLGRTQLRENFRRNAGTRRFDTTFDDYGYGVDSGILSPADLSEDRRRTEEAVFGRASNLLQEGRESDIARMAAMGLAPGTEAFGRVSDQYERSANDLALQSVLAGGQEQSRMMGEARANRGMIEEIMMSRQMYEQAARQLENARRTGDVRLFNEAQGMINQARVMEQNLANQAGVFQNTARSQYVNELMAKRNQPLNEISAFLSGAQVQAPQPMPYSTQGINPAPIGQYMYNSAGMEQDRYNNMLSGMMGLGQTGASLALGFL